MSDKLDFSKPDQLQTRDGRQVRIYATDGRGPFSIHGSVFSDHEGWQLTKWDINGRNIGDAKESIYDLIPKPRRITGWMNVYEGILGNSIFATKEAAKAVAGERALGQIYIDAEVQE